MGTVHDITGLPDYYDTISTKGKLVVVDFGATWCGHCVNLAPHYDALAAQFPDVLFAKVMQDKTPQGDEICREFGAGSFPTFGFFINGVKKDEMKGANLQGLEAKVVEHSASVPVPPRSFEGSGFSLGGVTSPLDAAAAREARLKRFGGGGGGGEAKKSSTSSSSSSSSSAAMADDQQDEDSGLQAALQMSMSTEDAAETTASSSSSSASAALSGEVPPAPPAVEGGAAEEGSAAAATTSEAPAMVLPPVNEAVLAEVMQMGFPEVRARKGLASLTQPTAESVVNWVLEHGEDPGDTCF